MIMMMLIIIIIVIIVIMIIIIIIIMFDMFRFISLYENSSASLRVASLASPSLRLLVTGRDRFGSIRFRSGIFIASVRYGSVRTIICTDSTRFGLRFSDASWLVPVRFCSFPRPVPKLNGSARFGSVRLGSVSYSFLP